MPTIAAVLAVAAARMCPWGFLHTLWCHARADFCVCMLTATLAVTTDMIVGLLVGTVVALLRNAALTARAPRLVTHAVLPKSEHHVGVRDPGRATTVTVVGPVTYVNAREVLARGLASDAGAAELAVQRTLLDLRRVLVVDWEGLDALHTLLTQLDAAATDGAHVAGPDGVEVHASAVKDKFKLGALLRTVPQSSELQ